MPKSEKKSERTKRGSENITRLLAKGSRLPDGERKSPGGTDVLAAVIAEWPGVKPAVTSNIASTENLDLAHTTGAKTRKQNADDRRTQWRHQAEKDWPDHPGWIVDEMAGHIKAHFKAPQSVATIADAIAGIKARALLSND